MARHPPLYPARTGIGQCDGCSIALHLMMCIKLCNLRINCSELMSVISHVLLLLLYIVMHKDAGVNVS